ncbi:6879_t:CDS:2 [Paraglomus brasilianum]|uniref:6879_t:CDS:1 n=1 Tax=Paraglomus brasilianum TaxID=144538 RepID=A0A9N9BIJ6_9GLOM|nr:6879_t:CDS:2 [Paraglomus brasilianum]
MERIPIIIDTDPGIDDALALLLALSSPVLEVKAITTVFGNTGVDLTSRNTLTVLHILETEVNHIKNAKPPEGDDKKWEKEMDTMTTVIAKAKPIIAIGADKPLEARSSHGTYYHGQDGLGEIHTTHPFYTPPNWESILKGETTSHLYTISSRSSADEILYQLQTAPPLTVTIIALGPLTNLALAYKKDPETFSRADRIILLGGAVYGQGNTTPVAEFNFFADPHAANVIIGATKGYDPNESMDHRRKELEDGNAIPLHVIMIPIEVSSKILLPKSYVTDYVKRRQSPLSLFVSTFLEHAYTSTSSRVIQLHDPAVVAMLIDIIMGRSHWKTEFTDVRVESEGYYTRGMCVVDRRPEPIFADVETFRQASFGIWTKQFANNVELCVGCEPGKVLKDFFKGVFNVDIEDGLEK